MFKLKIITNAIFAIALCVATAVSPSLSRAAAPAPLPARQHPLLFLNSAQFRAVADRAQTLPWAKTYKDKIIAEADEALKRPLNIPDKVGEWSHHYVCKTCGVDLKQEGDKNVCPRCGKEYTGWPYDGVIAGRTHHKNIDDAKALALAYQLTGRQAYADKCRTLLLGYADRYPKFPIHDYKGTQIQKGAKLFAQTLDESVRMIPLVWSYDMVYGSPTMTAADRTHIETDLFSNAAQVIRRNDMGVSNWQSWHNAAMAAIGYVLGDAELVDHAINNPKGGMKFQLSHSILKDGFWYEGTASYHFYALQALQWQALEMKAAGNDLYKEATFESLYSAPLEYAFPDGNFPAVNDSDPLSIKAQAVFYEVAYALYGDPAFAEVADLGNRKTEEAFLFGANVLPAEAQHQPKSHDFPGLGATMLRQPTKGNPLAVHFDYGPHGSAHGHYDKLGIILFANGTDIMPDPGRLAYGTPLHARWYKTSLAHNTVIVDGKNQAEAEGKLVSSSFNGPIQQATATCEGTYKGVSLSRSLALAPEYLLDVMTGKSSEDHTWDLAYHVNGKPETALAFQPKTLEQTGNGYQVITNVRSAMLPSGPLDITFKNMNTKPSAIRLLQQATVPQEIILADGVTGGDVTTCPMVISRQKGKDAQWITLSIPAGATPVKWAIQQKGNEQVVTITAGSRTDSYTVENGQLRLAIAPQAVAATTR